ncbi:MAG: hypothetical protein Ct9H90mP27_0290 [Gammaproteobacteria bacterium]|nr:MAG: hypothetical protein Ct9H90mP27_0290 [Gammaproteobacteria bacterium]
MIESNYVNFRGLGKTHQKKLRKIREVVFIKEQRCQKRKNGTALTKKAGIFWRFQGPKANWLR